MKKTPRRKLFSRHRLYRRRVRFEDLDEDDFDDFLYLGTDQEQPANSSNSD